MIAEPILEGNPTSDSWPYKNVKAGAGNGLHCGPNGMWAEPRFCSDYAEFTMKSKSGSLSLDRTSIGFNDDVTERLGVDTSSEDERFCNTSAYPVIAVIDIQWPWVNYAGAEGVAFDVFGNASLPCATDTEFLKGSVNTSNFLNPSGPAPSQGTVLPGGSRRFFCPLCPGECLGPVEMWVSARIVTYDESKKINSVCFIEDDSDGSGDDDKKGFKVFYANTGSNGQPVIQELNYDGTGDDPPDVFSDDFASNIEFSHGGGQINIMTIPDCNRTDCPC